MKKLSIIIPFKGQTEKDLAIPLASINGQIGFDFSQIDVNLINDGGESIDPSKFDIFGNLTIRYHELKENVGPGMARQYGIDYSEGEYLMFMDSDDEMHYAGGLLDFFNLLKDKGDHPVIIARFLEQQRHNDTFYYIQSDTNNWGALHGKFFKRSYLLEKELRFHPGLREANEDLYFVGLACLLADHVQPLESVIYSWLWNKNSLSRIGENGLIHKTHLFVDYCYFSAEKIREKKHEIIRSSVISSAFQCYDYYKNYPPLTPEDEQLFFNNMLRYWNDFEAERENESLDLAEASKKRLQEAEFQAFLEKVKTRGKV
ncbi:MAG: glycosyltransferase family 2 protein [Lactovum sp.]